MKDRLASRLQDIVDAIDQIDILFKERSFSDLSSDRIVRAAYERFLEIISEASRHIPTEMKRSQPATPWRKIADIGNHLRHAYFRVDALILWDIHANGELSALRSAVTEFLAKLDSDG